MKPTSTSAIVMMILRNIAGATSQLAGLLIASHSLAQKRYRATTHAEVRKDQIHHSAS